MSVAASLRRLGLLVRMRPHRRRLLAEAAWSLLAARMRSAHLSAAREQRRWGPLVSPADPRVAACNRPLRPGDVAQAEAVRWAVRLMAPHMPFRALCLQQAMAARAMLRRRGVASILHFGAMRRGAEMLESHAWLDAAGVRVTGYPIDPALTELGCLL